MGEVEYNANRKGQAQNHRPIAHEPNRCRYFCEPSGKFSANLDKDVCIIDTMREQNHQGLRKQPLPMLEAVGLAKQFGGRGGFALQPASFAVAQGQLAALLGESGSGKTTLLRLIAGFETPDAGEVRLQGRAVSTAGWALAPEQRQVGMVFQDYALFPHLDVAENVGYGLPRRDPRRASRIGEMLELVGLPGLGKRFPHQLSGGQQQRVALARALAPNPALLLLDEPFSNLDESLKAQVREDLRQILRDADATAVFVTHDTKDALAAADWVVMLRQGCVVQQGRPEDLYFRPESPQVAEYFGPVNWVEAVARQHVLELPWGKVELPQAAPLQGPCRIGIRPESWRDEGPGLAWAGSVRRQAFQGAYRQVWAQGQGGLSFQAWRFSHLALPGEAVWHCPFQELLWMPAQAR
jgi:iron(III) transport system ATP-binding protein